MRNLCFAIFMICFNNLDSLYAKPTLIDEVTVKSSIATGKTTFPTHNGYQFFRFDEGPPQTKLVFLDKSNLAAPPYKVSFNFTNSEIQNLIDSPSGRYTLLQLNSELSLRKSLFLIDVKMKTSEEINISSEVDIVRPSISDVRFSKDEAQVAIFTKYQIVVIDLKTKQASTLEKIPELSELSDSYTYGPGNWKTVKCSDTLIKPCLNYDFRFSSDGKKIEFIGALTGWGRDGVVYISWDLVSTRKLDFHFVKKGRVYDGLQAQFLGDTTILVKMLNDEKSKIMDFTSNQEILTAENILSFPSSKRILVVDGNNLKALDAFSFQHIFEVDSTKLHLQSHSHLMVIGDSLIAFSHSNLQTLSEGRFKDIYIYNFNGPQIIRESLLGSYLIEYFSRFDNNEYVSAMQEAATGDVSFKFFRF